MAKRIELKPPWPWAEKFPIVQGIRLGERIYVSGQIAFDPEGNVTGEGDMGAQARQVFENIRAVLAEAGAAMDDMVKITGYLTDMSRYAEYSAARAAAFPNKIPASTTIATPALALPEMLVEVEAVAEIGSGSED